MRVLFIGPLPEPITGQSLACQVFHDHLAKQHQIDLVNLSKRGFTQGMNSAGRLLEVIGIIWRAWRRCRQADLIYFTVSESWAGNAKDLLIFLVCFERLKHMAIHLHGGAGMRTLMGKGHPLSRAVNAFFLRRMGAVIVLGNALKNIYSEFVPASRLHVIPNFAEDHLFVEASEIEAKFEAKETLKLLFLSNLLPGKGHVELVQGYCQLSRHDQDRVAIEFAGSFEDDRQRDEFLSMIRTYPNLRYHGPVRGATKVSLFKHAHVFCLPTYYPYEGQPISILEAYATGCAVISSDHSGIPDVFTDRVNGLLVKVRSPESIRGAIEAALADSSFLLASALHNRRDAEVKYRAARYNLALSETLIKLRGELGTPGEPRA